MEWNLTVVDTVNIVQRDLFASLDHNGAPQLQCVAGNVESIVLLSSCFSFQDATLQNTFCLVGTEKLSQLASGEANLSQCTRAGRHSCVGSECYFV